MSGHFESYFMLTADPFPMRLMCVGLFKPKNTILVADIARCVEAVAETSNSFCQGGYGLWRCFWAW